MKKIIIIIVSIIILIFLGFWIFNSRQPKKILGSNIEINYTLNDVLPHSTVNDCWTIIDTGVYDITKYISQHPGGIRILEACGVNATDLFSGTSPVGRVHSQVARKLLSGMKIGNFKSN